MDGLEAVEIKYSDLRLLKTMRLDNEYFSKDYIENEKLLQKFGYKTVGEIVSTITDFGAYSQTNFIEFQEHGINFFRNQDVNNNNIDSNGCAKISNETYNRLTLKLQEKDILMPRTGTLGNAGVVEKTHLPASANQNLAVLRNVKAMLPQYVSIVLCSKIGLLQINRNSTGNVQQWLNLDTIKDIKIPNATEEFQTKIEETVLRAHTLLDDSNKKYHEAEELLEKEIGIDMSAITSGGVSLKSFAESFGTSGRLDSEYYQPKYDEFKTHVLHYPNGYTTPSSEFELIKTKCDRTLKEYPYVEIGNVDIGTGAAEYSIVPTNELPTNAKIMTHKGDLLVSTVRPYRGAVSILNEDDLLVSAAFTVLRETGTYPAQTLQVLFRTSLYKDWLLKFNVGTSYPVIKDDDVINIPIPILSNKTHKEIKEKVKQSQELLNVAKKLIECAKQAVEMALETNEEKAISWLETQE